MSNWNHLGGKKEKWALHEVLVGTLLATLLTGTHSLSRKIIIIL